MTEEDFEDDDGFEDEFDFVDEGEEEEQSSEANTQQPPAGNSPAQNGQKPSGSRIGVLAIAAIIVLAGSYYGFDMLSGGSDTKADTTAAKPKQANQTQTATGPLPPPVDNTTETEEVLIAEDDYDSVNFADAFADNAQPELTDAVPTKPQAQTTANGSTKTFQQMQQELKASSSTQTATDNAVKMQVPEEINAALDSISEEMNLNVKQVRQLETSISAIVSSIDQLNRTLSAMDNRVLGLTETVDALSKDLVNVKKIIIEEDLDLTAPATVKFTNKKQTESITSNAPSYTVHAIIPGRAWLKSSGGQIITVREGDKVGDYGTVAVIDAGNGLVRTSSGITFR